MEVGVRITGFGAVASSWEVFSLVDLIYCLEHSSKLTLTEETKRSLGSRNDAKEVVSAAHRIHPAEDGRTIA